MGGLYCFFGLFNGYVLESAVVSRISKRVQRAIVRTQVGGPSPGFHQVPMYRSLHAGMLLECFSFHSQHGAGRIKGGIICPGCRRVRNLPVSHHCRLFATPCRHGAAGQWRTRSYRNSFPPGVCVERRIAFFVIPDINGHRIDGATDFQHQRVKNVSGDLDVCP